jgi:hypothetical protein
MCLGVIKFSFSVFIQFGEAVGKKVTAVKYVPVHILS